MEPTVNWGTEMTMAYYQLPGKSGTGPVYIKFSGGTELIQDELYNVTPGLQPRDSVIPGFRVTY